MTHSVHTKGFNSFDMSSYHEGGTEMIAALRAGGAELTYQPSHIAMNSFPFSRKEIDAFDVVILSDIGANSLLLPDRVAIRSESWPNRLHLIRDFVNDGGGLLMVGGYLTFQGIQAKGNYKGSPVEDVLPIELLAHDDRVECPQGVTPTIVKSDHAVLKGLTDWPQFLGYNRSTARPDADVLARVGDDPFIAVRNVGTRAQRDLRVRLRTPLGPPALPGLEGLRRALDQSGWLARRETSTLTDDQIRSGTLVAPG